MKTILISIPLFFSSLMIFSSCNSSNAASTVAIVTDTTSAKEVLKLSQIIPLTGVRGRIDHMAYDSAGQKVFICALGNGSVEVVDLKSGKVIHSIKKLAEPQGIAFDDNGKRLFVACGDDGFMRVFDSENYKQLDSLKIGSDADNVRYDSLLKRIYIGYDGGLAVLNSVTMKLITHIELDGHLESFQLNKITGQIYVNIPDAYEIEVVDIEKNTVSNKWKINDARDNFPMSLDEKGHRVFVACRHPSKIFSIDDRSGKVLSTFNCSGDADDIFYDSNSKMLITSCGQGIVELYKGNVDSSFSLLTQVATRSQARTSLLIRTEKKYFLALPATTGKDAELRTYNLLY